KDIAQLDATSTARAGHPGLVGKDGVAQRRKAEAPPIRRRRARGVADVEVVAEAARLCAGAGRRLLELPLAQEAHHVCCKAAAGPAAEGGRYLAIARGPGTRGEGRAGAAEADVEQVGLADQNHALEVDLLHTDVGERPSGGHVLPGVEREVEIVDVARRRCAGRV